MNSVLSRYVLRIGIAIVIWLFFKITSASTVKQISSLTEGDLYYLIFSIVTTLLSFEIIDLVKRVMLNKVGQSFGEPRHMTMFFFISFIGAAVVIVPMLISLEFIIKPWIRKESIVDSDVELAKNIFSSMIITSVLITGYIIQFLQNRQRKLALIQAELNNENIAMKYSALKSQLNPHFLFNSLSVLTSLVYKNPDTASDFISQLSKIHRYVLDNKENDVVSLKEELSFIRSYMYLMQIRHEHGIQVDYRIALDESSFFIPTLTLQLLVENAIKHTGFNEDHPLKIELFNEGEESLIIRNNLRVRNATKERGTNTGIQNIENRYILLGESKPDINISSEHFTVKIPLIKNKY